MIYLDSSNVEEIKRFKSYGIIDGVTSNPSIMLKDEVKDVEKAVKELVKVTHPLHLSVEVMTNDEDQMIYEARQYAKLSGCVVIKIPIHDPNGELDNLRVIHKLWNMEIKVNATCCMNAIQCILAAKAGADYVSLFGGRVNDMGGNAVDEISKIIHFLSERHIRKPDLIIGSVREAKNVLDWLEAGADIVTVPPSILEKMIVHVGTKDVVSTFLNDARKITNGR
jgi:transaldolase